MQHAKAMGFHYFVTQLQHKVPLQTKRELGALIFLFQTTYQKLQNRLGIPVAERVVEHSWLLGHLLKLKGRLLDAGACFSYFSHLLAMRGLEVWVLDFNPFPQFHPRSTFIRGDASQLPFRDEGFDIITSVSTIEHIGTGEFGVPYMQGGDLRAMAELRRILRSEGSLFITVPYGLDRGQATHRFYDDTGLSNLSNGFRRRETRYGIRRGSRWRIEEECPLPEHPDPRVNTIAMLHLVKP